MVSVPEELILDPKRRVLSVVEAGFEVNFSESIPLHRYYKSLNEIVRMANVYLEERSYESALKLFTRFSCLLLHHLPKHPLFKSDTSFEKQKAKEKLKEALNSAEKVKKKLRERYEAEAEVFRKQKEEQLAAEAKAAAERKTNEQRLPSSETPPAAASPADFGIVNTQSIEFPELNDRIAPPLPLDSDGATLPSPTGPSVPPRDTKPNYPAAEIFPDVPVVDRSQKPAVGSLGVSYIPQNRYGLRNVVIPQMLVRQFLQLADSNTSRNIETVGSLAGKLSATPDSCDKEEDVMVCEFQDKHDLITVGWIHTHPSQTAFLSSVDMHTHYPYQLLLPEAVAVVCSVKYQETGIFMLSPDAGMRQIGNCRQDGHHPHDQDPPLFERCPHAVIADGYQATVVDFRDS